MTNEAFSRVKIDAQLKDEGWEIQNPNEVRYEYPLLVRRFVSSQSPYQGDGHFGTGLHALAAGLTHRRERGVGALTAMHDASELSNDAELREVGRINSAHLKHIVGANLDALGLSLAFGPIDDRNELSG